MVKVTENKRFEPVTRTSPLVFIEFTRWSCWKTDPRLSGLQWSQKVHISDKLPGLSKPFIITVVSPWGRLKGRNAAYSTAFCVTFVEERLEILEVLSTDCLVAHLLAWLPACLFCGSEDWTPGLPHSKQVHYHWDTPQLSETVLRVGSKKWESVLLAHSVVAQPLPQSAQETHSSHVM